MFAAFTRRTLETNPADNKDFRYAIKPLRQVLLDGADSTAKFVLAGAATLLLLAILNLASLLINGGVRGTISVPALPPRPPGTATIFSRCLELRPLF